MSNKILFPFIAVSLCLVSCVQESRLSSDSAAVVRTVLNASLPELGKTSIDGVKVCWSSGDEICVNGSRSYPLSEPSSYASFSFEDVLSLPYSAVYPASLWKNSSTVTLPSSWNPALQQIPLRAYSESEGEVSFSAFTAVIRLLVSGSAASIEKVELSA
ncbi:MAG: hypothetical protein J5764_04165, partial [Bacteroidales bacterium]|nr:hypothetical protein [Bacteroidales bacterium]